MGFKLVANYVRDLASRWVEERLVFKKRGYPFVIRPFTFDQLCGGIGHDPMIVRERNKVYFDVILYWRKKASVYWDELERKGALKGNRLEKWKIFLWNYNEIWRAFFFLYDRKQNAYYQPNLVEKEVLDYRRLERQIIGIGSVAGEMKEFDEVILLTGKPARELLEDADKIRMKYLEP